MFCLLVHRIDPYSGQNVRTSGRNEDVPFAEGLVVIGSTKRPHRKIALPGHLQMSAHQSSGYDK